MSELFNESYYKNCCGLDYSEESHWIKFFGNIADRIVADFNPKTVLDAGCAWGYLVSALRDRGVEAYGIDISSYAISKVRVDVKPYCAVCSLTESLPSKFPKKFDLVTSIEVLEHMYEEDGIKAICNLCSFSDIIIFSSTSEDITETTHVNVQQSEYWVHHFAENGFFNQIDYVPNYISNAAMLLCRSNNIARIAENYERNKRILKSELEKLKVNIRDVGYTTVLFFDVGSNFQAENAIFAQSTTSAFCQNFNLEAGVTALRFDPVEGKGCIVQNLEIVSNNGPLTATNLNGITIDNFDVFTNTDPQFLISLEGKQTLWVRIKADIISFEDMAWFGLLSKFDILKNTEIEMTAALEAKGTEMATALKAKEAEIAAVLEAKEKEMATALQAKEAEMTSVLETKNTIIADYKEHNEKIESELDHYKTHYFAAINQRNDLSNQLTEVSGAYQLISNSTCWKMTKSLRIVLDFTKRLLKSNRVTHMFRKGLKSLKKNGVKYTWAKVKCKLNDNGAKPVLAPEPVNSVIVGHDSLNSNINPELYASLKRTQPIQSIILNEDVKRINLVTDSIEKNSLLGGVATALVIVTELANRLNIPLRIITRTTPVNPVDYKNIMKISGVESAKDVTFYSDYDRDEDGKTVFKLELSPKDIFVATSWWSAEAIRNTTLRKRFFYIIQEVETFFYPYGDEHFLCSQVMKNENIDFIINSKYLYDYFKEYETIIAKNGVYFQPAFPEILYRPKQTTKKGKYKLFFYARPNNPRNMFSYGIKILEKCISTGILKMTEWDIYCAGGDIPEIQFSNGYKTINLGLMKWSDYAEFLGEIDLALSLMYTPHPSYPPYDVACSGGVVVTNACFNKVNFDQCDNVIISDLDEERFLQAMENGIKLAQNMKLRKENSEKSTIPRSWNETLIKSLDFMEELVNHV